MGKVGRNTKKKKGGRCQGRFKWKLKSWLMRKIKVNWSDFQKSNSGRYRIFKRVVSHDSIFMEGSKQEKVKFKWVSVGSIFNPINNNFMKKHWLCHNLYIRIKRNRVLKLKLHDSCLKQWRKGPAIKK